MSDESGEESALRAERASLGRRAAAGVAWSVLRFGATQTLSLGAFAVLGRLLTKDDFGVVALGLAFTAVGDILSSQGVADYVVQRQDLDDESSSTAFWLNLGLATVLAATLFALADAAGAFFEAPKLPAVIRWLTLSLVIRSLTVVQTGYLTREMRFRALAVRGVIVAVAGGAAGIIAALCGMGAMALVVQNITAAVTSCVVLWTASPWRPRWIADWTSLRSIISFGGGLLGAALLRFAGARFDQFVLGATFGTATVGVYSVARKISEMVTRLVVKSGDSVAFSAFSRLQSDEGALDEGYRAAIRYGTLLSVPVFVLVGVMAQPLIVLLLGERWEGAGPILQVLCLAGIFMGGSYVAGSMIKASGGTHLMFLIHVLLTLLNVIGALLAYPFGILAVACVYTVSVMAIRPVELLILKRRCKVRLDSHLEEAAPAFVASAVAGGLAFGSLVLLAESPPILKLLAGGTTGIVGFAITLTALFPTHYATLRSLVGRVRRLRRRPRSSPAG